MAFMLILISDKYFINFFWLNLILRLIERLIYLLEFEDAPEFSACIQ